MNFNCLNVLNTPQIVSLPILIIPIVVSHGPGGNGATDGALEEAPPEKLRTLIASLRQENRLLELTLAQQLSDEKNKVLFSPMKREGRRTSGGFTTLSKPTPSPRVPANATVHQLVEENKNNVLEMQLMRERLVALEEERRRGEAEKKRMRLSFQLQRDKYRQKLETLREENEALKGVRFSYIGDDLREKERALLTQYSGEEEVEEDGDDLVVEDEYRKLEDDNERLRQRALERTLVIGAVCWC